jgi:hypothetical protein
MSTSWEVALISALIRSGSVRCGAARRGATGARHWGGDPSRERGAGASSQRPACSPDCGGRSENRGPLRLSVLRVGWGVHGAWGRGRERRLAEPRRGGQRGKDGEGLGHSRAPRRHGANASRRPDPPREPRAWAGHLRGGDPPGSQAPPNPRLRAWGPPCG